MALTLHIDDAAVGVAGAVAINWCLPKEEAQALVGKEAYVLIVIAPAKYYNGSAMEQRMLVPLTDPMAFVSFDRSGPHRIFARLHAGDPLRLLKNSYLRKKDGDFVTNVLSSDGDSIYSMDYGAEATAELMTAVLPVDVPPSAFAEPPAWEEAWVNWLFREKPRDQCEYRKRRFTAYPVGAVTAFFKIAIAVLIVGFRMVMLLARKSDFRAALHPLTYDLEYGAWRYSDGFVWWPHGDEHKSGWSWYDLRILLIPFMPLYVLVTGGIGVLHNIATYKGKDPWWVRALWGDVGVTGVLVCLVLLVLLGAFLYDRLTDEDTKEWARHAAVRFSRKYDALLDRFLGQQAPVVTGENFALLTCDAEAKPLKLGQVPWQQRTIRLRFYDLKAKICKPFAR